MPVDRSTSTAFVGFNEAEAITPRNPVRGMVAVRYDPLASMRPRQSRLGITTELSSPRPPQPFSFNEAEAITPRNLSPFLWWTTSSSVLQ